MVYCCVVVWMQYFVHVSLNISAWSSFSSDIASSASFYSSKRSRCAAISREEALLRKQTTKKESNGNDDNKAKNNNQTLFSHSKRRTKSPCRTSAFQITKLNLFDCFFIIIWIWGGVVVFVLPPLLLLRSAHEKTSARRNATKSKIGWPHRSVAG